MIRASSFLCAALLAAGCAGAAPLASVDDLQLCAAYGDPRYAGGTDVKAEIDRRRLLTDEEWRAVAERRIFVGMTACGLLAARGDPRPAGAVEQLGVRTGPYLQWVYRSGDGRPPLYVYTDSGRIVGWQQ